MTRGWRAWGGAAVGVVVGSRAFAQPTGDALERERDGQEPKQPLVLATGEPSSAPPEQVEDYRYWEREHHYWHSGVAIGVGFGPAFVKGSEQGFYARLDLGAYDIETRRRGWIGGMLMGFEGWRARVSDERVDGGGSLPMVIFGGLQQDAFFCVLGAGFDMLLVDHVNHDTGFGVFAPLASLSIGLDLEGVRFLVDARPGYRWQWGAEDRAILRVGGVVQLTTD